MLLRGKIQRTIIAIALASMLGFIFLTACAEEAPPPTPTVEMPSPTAVIESPIESAQRATVMIIGPDEAGEPYALGSGSIIDPRGLVLTNFHVIGNLETGELYNSEGIAWVGLTPKADIPPSPWYTARVLERDVDLDLVVLEIVADVDGNPLTEGLNLPTVPTGDSASLHLGDKMSIFGYPATGFLRSPEEFIGSITLTQGIVSGFLTSEDGVRIWIKTDAEMSGGNSGGLAIDEKGELTGIPTQESPDRLGRGKLGLIRPVNLARPLIDLAQQKAGAKPLPTIAKVPTPTMADPYREARKRMVETQLRARGVSDEAVLAAMETVPRHEFVPDKYLDQAYADHPLPIGYGQTISQPFIVAWMTELLQLERGDKVLEIGTGSAYQAAVLAVLTDQVYTMEIIEELEKSAEERLKRLGYTEVKVKHADGYYGWEEYAPYDAIIVTCAPDHIPQPLIQQLKDGGRLVIPVGPPGGYQSLWLITKQGDQVLTRNLGGVRFVPLTGEH